MGETEDERVETPAEASESAKGDLSYHYWHLSLIHISEPTRPY